MALKLWSKAAPLVIVMASLCFGLDQFSKYWVLDILSLETHESFPVLPFFNITLVWNFGISYGLFATHQQGVLAAIAVLISVGVWLWVNSEPSRMNAIAAGLIVGGALANSLDRLVRGAVVDFMHLFYQDFSWYIFNIADVGIVLGAVLIVTDGFWPAKEKSVLPK